MCIVVVIGDEVVIGEDRGVCILKKSEIGVEYVSGVDTFRIGVVVGGTEVAVVSSTSF